MKVINHNLRYHSPWKLPTKEVKKYRIRFFFPSPTLHGLFYLYKVARTWGSEQWSNFLCWNLLKRFPFNSQKLRIIEMKNNCEIRFSLNVATKCLQFSVFLTSQEKLLRVTTTTMKIVRDIFSFRFCELQLCIHVTPLSFYTLL